MDGEPNGDAHIRDGEETGGGREDSSSLGEAHVMDQSDRWRGFGEVRVWRRGGMSKMNIVL